MRYKGNMTKRQREKKKRFEYIFPKHLKSVGGEQPSDKRGTRTDRKCTSEQQEVQREDKGKKAGKM